VSIPDPFDVEPVHITIHDKPLPSHDDLRAIMAASFQARERARERASTLEALTDQLAEALRRRSKIDWPSDECHCLACDALRAYEADKEAHR
jgi:cytochrome P450